MKTLILLGLILCCFACVDEKDKSPSEVSDEKVIFNKTIESLSGFGGFSKVFGQFNFDVKLADLKRVIRHADSTLTSNEIDTLCSEYYINCSLSIHDFINEKNKEFLVYRIPRGNVNMYGYPIIIGEDKAVIISYHYEYHETNYFELFPVVLVYEKDDFVWKKSKDLILIMDE